MGAEIIVPKLHPYCYECKKTRVSRKDGPMDPSGVPLYKRGDFIINCKGILADDNIMPNQEKVKALLSPEEFKRAVGVYNPVQWAKDQFNWTPRVSRGGTPYQELMVRCTAKRKVYRNGRRLGKTNSLAVEASHFAANNSPKVERWDRNLEKFVQGFGTTLVVAPFLSQIKLIFNQIREFCNSSPELKNEIIRDVSTPYHVIEFKNGSQVLGFSAGANNAKTIRGQKADLIILDEMDYLDEGTMDAIVAILMEHSDVTLIGSSTPSGREGHFFSFCKERMDYKEFHFKSYENPNWNPAMEAELRETYKTQTAWALEIEAEFTDPALSVFQHVYVDKARAPYTYGSIPRNNTSNYAMGVDWNDVANGTRILILEWSSTLKKFRVVEKYRVSKEGWNQTAAVDKIIEVNRIWRPNYLYMDTGFGGMQIEVLKKFGIDAQYRTDEHSIIDTNLKSIVGINFSSRIEVPDPISGKLVAKSMKPYMVENAVRRFEQGFVEFPEDDETLYRQIIGYMINRITPSGVPVYEAGPEGDHDLDALMLGLLAFQLETSELLKPNYSAEVRVAGKFGDANPKPTVLPVSLGQRTKFQVRFPGNHRIYSPAAFSNDDPKRNSRSSFTRGDLARMRKVGRRSF